MRKTKYFFLALSFAYSLIGSSSTPMVVLGSDPLHIPTQFTVHDGESIRAVIDLSMDGDIILVNPGFYQENIDFLGKNINLISTDPNDAAIVASTILDGGNHGPVISFLGTENAECLLSGFTIIHGSGGFGGGVSGGAETTKTQATISRNRIVENSASYGGGVAFCRGVLANNIITSNTIGGNGGGIYQCDGSIEGNLISGNSAWMGGGIAYAANVVRGNMITRNSAMLSGGGLFECDLLVESNQISGNTAANGGGLHHCQGTIRGNMITDNEASGSAGGSSGMGGGLSDCFFGTIEQNTISRNTAINRGAGLEGCFGTIQYNIISENQAILGASGGGLSNCGGNILSNDIVGNFADSGGGLYECSGLISKNTIANNRSTGGGGGIRSCNEVTIEANLIIGNRIGDDSTPPSFSSGYGAGIYNCNVPIRNNVIAFNTTFGPGGGLAACQGALENNTIFGNHAGTRGGGVYFSSPTYSVTLYNCIVWQNTAGHSYPQAFNAQFSYSDIQDWTGAGIGNISLDPQFVDPGQRDFHLNPGSPCIDAGARMQNVTVDIDGNARGTKGATEQRGDGSNYDIGAYEFVPPPPQPNSVESWAIYE